MVISGITHPKGIFRDSAMLTSLGIKPYREVKQNSRYYDLGSYSVDTSGDEVVGTYAGSAKSVASIQSLMLEKVNDQVADMLIKITGDYSTDPTVFIDLAKKIDAGE